MKMAGSFAAAIGVAEQNCREWIYTGSGEIFHADELREIAREYDSRTPLEEDEFLIVTDDGSIGMALANLKEPQWFFVTPGFAVANILHDDFHKYIVPIVNKAVGSVAGKPQNVGDHARAQAVQLFCKNCDAPLHPGSRFCENCGMKNTQEFCANCGAKLESDSVFCGNCGTKV